MTFVSHWFALTASQGGDVSCLDAQQDKATQVAVCDGCMPPKNARSIRKKAANNP